MSYIPLHEMRQQQRWHLPATVGPDTVDPLPARVATLDILPSICFCGIRFRDVGVAHRRLTVRLLRSFVVERADRLY